VWTWPGSRGSRLFDQDSDGNMNPLIETFPGLRGQLHAPFEPAAGWTSCRSAGRFGRRLAFYGGLDKHVCAEAARNHRQLEYKIPDGRLGRLQLGLDHRIPNGTPLESYRFYIAKAWEIMDRAGNRG